MCDDLRWAGRSARFPLFMPPATPLMGVSPMHASNRPFGWPAADMRRHGLLPEGLPLRARARPSIVPEYLTSMRSILKMAPLEEPKAFAHPSVLAGDLVQAPDPDRTGSGGAEKMKWGSIDAPREADPGHAKHGRYIEFVYESALQGVCVWCMKPLPARVRAPGTPPGPPRGWW